MLFLAMLLAVWLLSGKSLADDTPFFKPSGAPTWGKVVSTFSGARIGRSRTYALVVSISSYDHTYDIPSTHENAVNVKDYFLDVLGYDYVHVLTEEDVTYERVRNLIQSEFRNLIQKDDRFVLYWSGHGETIQSWDDIPQGFLPTKASKLDDISTMIEMSTLSGWVRKWIPAKQTLFLLDTCFSGYGAVSRQSPGIRTTVSEMFTPSRQTFTAGLEGQQTFASDRLGTSAFTHALLTGIDGAADTAGINGIPDGIVTLGELEEFVRNTVRRIRLEYNWSEPITPTVMSLGSLQGEFFFLSKNKRIAAREQDGEIFSGEFAYGIPMSASASLNLSPREVIALIQLRLLQAGYPTGSIDGIYGPMTGSAVSLYKSHHQAYEKNEPSNDALSARSEIEERIMWEISDAWVALGLSEIDDLSRFSFRDFNRVVDRRFGLEYGTLDVPTHLERGSRVFTSISSLIGADAPIDIQIAAALRRGRTSTVQSEKNDFRPRLTRHDLGKLSFDNGTFRYAGIEPIFEPFPKINVPVTSLIDSVNNANSADLSKVDYNDLLSSLKRLNGHIVYEPNDFSPARIVDVRIAGAVDGSALKLQAMLSPNRRTSGAACFEDGIGCENYDVRDCDFLVLDLDNGHLNSMTSEIDSRLARQHFRCFYRAYSSENSSSFPNDGFAFSSEKHFVEVFGDFQGRVIFQGKVYSLQELWNSKSLDGALPTNYGCIEFAEPKIIRVWSVPCGEAFWFVAADSEYHDAAQLSPY
ncbi:Polysaccharide deacetylase [Candidatus Rhodobacter oscarellae]|uniref:Polysaccharide deacetylase n=1 Tax=Candidatus Rhodobacter oscarellae TaxID=1675527 RepID=A0A0J9E3P4_9RHOB|nr:caspase family protein [Candidatus Rhodobacter lobularis]KMW57420.1 Polysaccharide deacetylase [Candidatus Rhodobacter lobularis]